MTDMTPANVTCSGYFDIPLDGFDAVLLAYQTHVGLSRKEPGNLAYDYRLDEEVPGRVHVYEVYIDEAAFDAHLVRTRDTDWPAISQHVIRHIGVSIGKAAT